MSPITGVNASSVAAASTDAERLRGAIRQLEGVFVQQLFAAMRETVPEDGVLTGAAGERIFTELLDERLASLVPSRWRNAGMEEAILRQLNAPSDPMSLPAPSIHSADESR